MLLAVQLIPHPKVPAHLQVQPTVRAGVAARVAVPPLLDAHGLVPVGGRSESYSLAWRVENQSTRRDAPQRLEEPPVSDT